jgi:hypothetical protein
MTNKEIADRLRKGMSKYEGHTPGPWQVSHVGGTWRHSVHSDSKSIGETANTTAEGHDEDEANARLMADAPKLLAERDRLREVLAKMPDCTIAFDTLEEIDRWKAWKREAFNPDGTVRRAALQESDDERSIT